jgi:hypothetical protein
MTKNSHSSRKSGKTARMPATKFPKLQKKLKTLKIPGTMKGKKF